MVPRSVVLRQTVSAVPERLAGSGGTDGGGDGGLRGLGSGFAHQQPPGMSAGCLPAHREPLIPGSHAMAAEIWEHRNGECIIIPL